MLEYLPREIIHLNRRLTDVHADKERGVDVTFANGTTIHADLLVGSDGIHSVRDAAVGTPPD